MLPLMIATIDDDADRAFMTRIYYRYRRYMYKTIGTFVSDPWDADDIFQTTLPNLIDHLDTLKSLPKNKLTAYIHAVCKNTAINFLRKKGRMKELSFEDFEERCSPKKTLTSSSSARATMWMRSVGPG